jgi:four helix bundle protein
MGVARFTDLDAWKLSKELQRAVLQLLDRPPLAHNFALRNQLDDAASSAPRNIAEGFGRFESREFAHFLKVSLGPLAEVQNHLIDVHDRGYITEDEHQRCNVLAKRAIAATTKRRAYLLSERNTRSSRRSYKGSNHENP